MSARIRTTRQAKRARAMAEAVLVWRIGFESPIPAHLMADENWREEHLHNPLLRRRMRQLGNDQKARSE